MKVKFLKSHDVYSKGDTEVLPEGLANYLIMCNVCEEHKETKPKKEKKVIEPDLEKK